MLDFLKKKQKPQAVTVEKVESSLMEQFNRLPESEQKRLKNKFQRIRLNSGFNHITCRKCGQGGGTLQKIGSGFYEHTWATPCQK